MDSGAGTPKWAKASGARSVMEGSGGNGGWSKPAAMSGT
jgi:hypothetical protein